MKSKTLLFIPLILAAILFLALGSTLHPALAQGGGGIFVDKQLGRTSPLVHVGEYITFTIRIRNDASFTVQQLPLSDNFNTTVLAYVDASIAPDVVDEAGGHLEWNDLTTAIGDMAIGQEVTLIVGFIAEHPQAAIVNAARVHDVVGSGGAISDTESIMDETESIGGSSPVDKQVWAGVQPQVGKPITYTIVITNDSYTTMTVAPVVDAYNPSWMTFSFGIPSPDVTDVVNGRLIWNDLTLYFGDLAPHQVVSITTVFTPLIVITEATNRVEVAGARDWYDNALDGGADQVPIVIVENDTTPVPTQAPTQAPESPASSPAESAPTPTLTPFPTVTPAPVLMPETGTAVGSMGWIWAVGFLLAAAGMGFLVLGRRQR